MRTIDLNRSAEPGDRLAFLRGFLRSPRCVGSVIPSSRFLERRVVAAAALAEAQIVVELGPGTGGTTRAILAALGPQARLLCIERDPRFAESIEAIGDPRLIVHCGDAARMLRTLQDHGLRAPHAVISGIPFSTLPPAVSREVAQSAARALATGGCFVAYQLRDEVVRFMTPLLGQPETQDLELRNIPPMRVWRWRKDASSPIGMRNGHAHDLP